MALSMHQILFTPLLKSSISLIYVIILTYGLADLTECTPINDNLVDNDDQASSSMNFEGHNLLNDHDVPVRLAKEANEKIVNILLEKHVLIDTDPCQNFYHFACGREGAWPHLDVAHLLDKRIESLLHDWVKYPTNSSANMKRLRDFNNSCESRQVGRADLTAKELIGPFVSLLTIPCPTSPATATSSSNYDFIIKEIGLMDIFRIEMLDYMKKNGQPIPQSLNCLNSENLDWIATSLHFAKLGVQYQYFFNMSLYLNSQDRKFWLRLKRKTPKSPRWQQMDYYVDNLKNFIPNRMMEGSPSRLKIEKKLTDVIEFRKKIFRDYQIDQSTNDKQDFRPIKLGQLIKEAPNTDWIRLISGLSGNTQLNEKSDFLVFVHRSGSIIELDHIIAQTKSEILADHIFLEIMESMMPLMRISLLPVENRRCVEITKRKLGLSLYVEYVRHFIDEGSRQDISAMVELMRGELLKMIDQSLDWLATPISKALARDVARSIKVIVGYPDNMLEKNDDAVEQHYDSIEFNGQFFENYVALARVDIQRTFKQLLGSIATGNSLTFFQDLTTGPLAHNKLFLKSIHLHPKLLDGSFFYNSHRAKEINFGLIGKVLGHEFAHSFDTNANRIYLDQFNAPILDRESMVKKLQQEECFMKQYGQLLLEPHLNNDNNDRHVDGVKTLMENLADNLGYWLSYRTFKQWQRQYDVQNDGQNNQILPGKLSHLTSNQIFWLSGAIFHCESRDKMLMTFDKYSPSVYRSNVPLQNIIEFSQDFNCPLGSPMNPVDKCKI